MNYTLPGEGAAPPSSGWFEPANARRIPTSSALGGVPDDEPISLPTTGRPCATPVTTPCQHERTVENLREWLSRQPFDGRVSVGEALLRLGRRPS